MHLSKTTADTITNICNLSNPYSIQLTYVSTLRMTKADVINAYAPSSIISWYVPTLEIVLVRTY